MKLLLLIPLLSLLSYHCCTGYPTVEGKISEDTLTKNGDSVELWLDAFSEIASDDSSKVAMHGFFKKIFNKLKDKVKNKINDCKQIFKYLADENLNDVLTEDDLTSEDWSNASPKVMYGFWKKVFDKVKGGFNKVNEKVKQINKCKNIFQFLSEEISEDLLTEMMTPTEYGPNPSNKIASSDSSQVAMHGFFKKIFNKLKDKVKNKIDDCKKIFKYLADENLDDALTEDDITSEDWSNASPKVMHGFWKKVFDKVKGGFNKVNEKVKQINKCKNIFQFLSEEISEDLLIEMMSPTEYGPSPFNEIASDDSSQVAMHGFFKKIFNKLKDKVKNKIEDCKQIFKYLADENLDDALTEDDITSEDWSNASPRVMRGFWKKVVDKVKGGFNKVNEKVKQINKCKNIFQFLSDELSEDMLNEMKTFSM